MSFGRSCLSRQRDPVWLLSARLSAVRRRRDAPGGVTATSFGSKAPPGALLGATSPTIRAEQSSVNSPLPRSDNLGHLGARHSVRGVCCCRWVAVGRGCRVTLGRASAPTQVPISADGRRCQAAPATVAHRYDSRTTESIEALLDRSTTGRATKRRKIGSPVAASTALQPAPRAAARWHDATVAISFCARAGSLVGWKG
jgi:hypothetical protein